MRTNESLDFSNVDPRKLWTALHNWKTRKTANDLHERLEQHYANHLAAPELQDIKPVADSHKEHLRLLARAITHYKDDSQDLNKGLILAHKNNIEMEREQPSMFKGSIGGRIKRLDDHLDAYAAPEEFKVYSGISPQWAQEKITKLRKGEYLHSPAYISATLKPSMAIGFAAGHYVISGRHEALKHGAHVLEVHIPEGSNHGAYIGHIGENKGEQEFLLKRDQYYKYHGVTHETTDPESGIKIYFHKVTPI